MHKFTEYVSRLDFHKNKNKILTIIGKGKISAPLYVDGRIILRWIFRKLEGVVGTGWS